MVFPSAFSLCLLNARDNEVRCSETHYNDECVSVSRGAIVARHTIPFCASQDLYRENYATVKCKINEAASTPSPRPGRKGYLYSAVLFARIKVIVTVAFSFIHRAVTRNYGELLSASPPSVVRMQRFEGFRKFGVLSNLEKNVNIPSVTM